MDIIYPNLCPGCSNKLTGSQRLCTTCNINLPYIDIDPEHPHHPSDMRLQKRFNYYAAYATFYRNEGGIIANSINSFKYGGDIKLGIFLGELMAENLAQYRFINRINMLIPVPLHKSKLYKRGFNQSLILCRTISDRFQIPIAINNLIRKISTESQTKKSRIERLDNMRATFKVLQPEKLIGKNILLVDDVLTTGATLESCALELLKISDTKISIATLAIAAE